MTIQVNFYNLQQIQREFVSYKEALEAARSAVTQIQAILLAENKGQWTAAMSANALKLKQDIQAVEQEVVDIQTLLKDYTKAMTAILQPKPAQATVYVDPLNIGHRLGRIKGAIQAIDASPSAAPANPRLVKPSDPNNQANEQYNGEQIANLKGKISASQTTMLADWQAMNQIYQKKVLQFEACDKHYGKKAQALYNKYSGFKERAADTAMGVLKIGEAAIKSLWGTITGTLQFVSDAIIGVLPIDCKVVNEAAARDEAIGKGLVSLFLHPGVNVQNIRENINNTAGKDGWGVVIGDAAPQIALLALGGAGAAGKLGDASKLGELGGAAKVTQTIDGIKIINGMVGGKIPIEIYKKIRMDSIINPDNHIMTLGKYNAGGKSYVVIAKDGKTKCFDLGTDWNKIKQEYHLTNQQMFDYFNKPALDDAIKANDKFVFTHDPRKYGGDLAQELKYLKKHGYIYDPKAMTAIPKTK